MDYMHALRKREISLVIGALVALVAFSVVSFLSQASSHLDQVEAAIHKPEAFSEKSDIADAGKIRWGYYVAYDRSSYESIKTNMKNLDYVSPYWYHMDGDGNLVVDVSVQDRNRESVIALARQNDVKILPLVQNNVNYDNFHYVLMDPATRSRAVRNLVDMVMSGNFDGIHVDFEGMSSTDRAGLTAFMAELHGALKPKGKLVTQAVAAKDKEQMTGWSGPYDYAELGKYNDFVVLMTYGYGTEKPQSTAPFPWVEGTAAYASKLIPAEKLILGLAWYGYDWNVSTGRHSALTQGQTADLIESYSPQITYDQNVQTPYFTYVANGQWHEVWYEDRRSNEAKVDLVHKYRLAGAGIWRIGHEEPGIWEAINARLAYKITALAGG